MFKRSSVFDVLNRHSGHMVWITTGVQLVDHPLLYVFQ